MFAVFTSPIKFSKSYKNACKIADDHYNKTGQVVAVESISNSSTWHLPSLASWTKLKTTNASTLWV